VTRVRANETFRTLFIPRMQATKLRVTSETGIASSVSTAMRGTMIYMALTMTSPLNVIHWLEPGMREESTHSLATSGINKYDRSTNLTEWLRVYQLAIEVMGGDSYIMENYLPIFLHRQPEPDSWGSRQDLSIHGQTCAVSSLVTSGPPVSDQESIGTCLTSCRGREGQFRNSSSVFATKGTLSRSSTTSPSSCSSRKDA
jgi:hypothetical protein